MAMMVSFAKVFVVVAAAILMVALLTQPATGNPIKRRKSRLFPSRRSYRNYPLAGFLPHEVPCCWYGYDSEGYSRNGRDLTQQTPDLGDTGLM